MNDAEKLKLEEMLRQAAPLIKRLSGPSVLPDRVQAALDQMLDKKFPVVRELTEKQMEGLLLKLVAEQPADGFELINKLTRAKFKLKEEDEGAIYAILGALESNDLLEGRWRESSGRMKKTYHLTENGSKRLERETATSSQLAAWANSVLSQTT